MISTDAIALIKYAAVMARSSKQPWAIYITHNQKLVAKPYFQKNERIVEICLP